MSNTMEWVSLTAADISCAHCVATINDALSKLDGVVSVETSATTKQVQVEYDPSQVSLPIIEAALDDAGYPVQE